MGDLFLDAARWCCCLAGSGSSGLGAECFLRRMRTFDTFAYGRNGCFAGEIGGDVLQQ